MGEQPANATMRAVVLSGPGPVENLDVVELPLPEPGPGWVRVRVHAAGLNRSELHTRLGLAVGVTFPRVPGIEATGVVDLDPDGVLTPGQQVVAMMGGMGRTFDGGYAQYTCVPREQLVPFRSELPWATLGAVPETLQTAYGSLTTGLDLQPGQTLLIRGGTSALGLAAAALAKDLGATVLATSRSAARLDALREHGVDHPLVDHGVSPAQPGEGSVAAQVRALFPAGVDAALELVGTPTLPDTLRATRVHGTVCFTGMLSNEWTVPDFYPIGYLPTGVRLTAYSGDAADLPAPVLQRSLDRIASGELSLGPIHGFPLDAVREAHDALEHGTLVGKLVLLPD